MARTTEDRERRREAARARKADPLYRLWHNIRMRIINYKVKGYSQWGGRGITMVKAWDSYEQFQADVGAHRGMGWTLTVLDLTRPFGPANYAWVQTARGPKLTEADVRSVLADLDEGKMSQAALARKYGVTQPSINHIARRKTWASSR